MTLFRLTASQRRRLERSLRAARDAGVFRRTLALLEADRGESVAAIARRLGTSRSSVYHWLARYQAAPDPATLADHRDAAGRPTVWDARLAGALDAALGSRPQPWGYHASEWTVPLLRRHLAGVTRRAVSGSTLRRELHRRGYVWKRPRYVLRPDPQRDKKTPAPSAAPPPGPATRGAVCRRDRAATVPTAPGGLGTPR